MSKAIGRHSTQSLPAIEVATWMHVRRHTFPAMGQGMIQPGPITTQKIEFLRTLVETNHQADPNTVGDFNFNGATIGWAFDSGQTEDAPDPDIPGSLRAAEIREPGLRADCRDLGTWPGRKHRPAERPPTEKMVEAKRTPQPNPL